MELLSDTRTICLMNDSFPPTIDGVANVVVNYAELLEKKYAHSIVVTPQYPNVEDNYPFEVVRYPSVNTTKLVGYRVGLPVVPIELTRLRNQNVSLIHSHCPLISTILARTLRDSADVPIVLTYHTKYDIDIKNSVSYKPAQDALIKTMVANISACDEVWAVSKGAGDNLRSLGYEGDVVIMENGVDFPKGRVTDESIAALKKQHNIDNDTTVFLFVGRLMWYKGLRLILDSLFELAKTDARFVMMFVGDGIEASEIKEYAAELKLSERVIFTGAISDRNALREYFCAADLFLFPSTFDTNGIVVREAAACALGSVLVSGSCAAEGVTDGVTALLTDGTVKNLTDKLTAAVNDRAECRALGERAKNGIYLSWEDSVAMAWERYGLVLESYRSKKRKRTELVQAELEALMRDMYAMADRFNERRTEFGKRLLNKTDKRE